MQIAQDDFSRGKPLCIFRIEEGERIQDICRELRKLERARTTKRKQKVLKVLFGDVKSLQRAAQLAGVANIERLCESMGRTIIAVQHQEPPPTQALINVLQKAVERLIRNARRSKTLAEITNEKPGPAASQRTPEAPPSSTGELTEDQDLCRKRTTIS